MGIRIDGHEWDGRKKDRDGREIAVVEARILSIRVAMRGDERKPFFILSHFILSCAICTSFFDRFGWFRAPVNRDGIVVSLNFYGRLSRDYWRCNGRDAHIIN